MIYCTYSFRSEIIIKKCSTILLSILFSLTALPQAFAQSIPVEDLSSWEQRGSPSSGNWSVASDHLSVTQTLNNSPTFFVSPSDRINEIFQGSIYVDPAAGDDDYIGFVLGFKAPTSTGDDMDFILFDWKKADQNIGPGSGLSPAGFSLVRVNGTIASTDYYPTFWWHENTDPRFTIIESDFAPNLGWEFGVTYHFEITYQTNRIIIRISGGTFGTGQTIFDVSSANAGFNFEAGRFGFYNFSQAGVTYSGLTQTPAPPTPPAGATPVPTLSGYGLLLLSALIGSAAFFRRRK